MDQRGVGCIVSQMYVLCETERKGVLLYGGNDYCCMFHCRCVSQIQVVVVLLTFCMVELHALATRARRVV